MTYLTDRYVNFANFTREEIDKYEDSLKYYRDLKNSFDTARDEGREEGREEEKERIARRLLRSGIAVELIAESTGLTVEQVELLGAGGA